MSALPNFIFAFLFLAQEDRNIDIQTADLLTALGLLGAALAWFYQWHISRFRSLLKDDLEILTHLKVDAEKNAEHITSIENSIDWMLKRAYPRTSTT